MVTSSASLATPNSSQQSETPQQLSVRTMPTAANSRIRRMEAAILIIIDDNNMINNINRELLNEQGEEKWELPQLKPGVKLPINYIKEYFQLKTLITIPHINITSFYQKIHTIRSIFITHIPNPKEYLVKEYSIKLSIAITDNLIHSSRQIIQKVQSLNKSDFTFQEEVDYNKTRRIYFGEMVLGKKEGYGVYAEYQILPEKENGSHFYFYEGFFSQNNKNGLGVQWSQNRIFIGQFVNNTHFSHTQAVFLYNNGDIYVGSIFNYKRNGRGVLFQSKPKGNQYYKYQTSQRYSQYESIVVGNWEDDEITRKNKFMLTTHFKDIFSMNLYDYQSNLLVKATSVYVGDLKHQKGTSESTESKEEFLKEGKGFEYFCNGDIYKGQYINDKPHGYGHYIWSNKDQYHGEFLKGHREGSGQWKGQNGEAFEGQYHKDQRNGYGIYQWPNGNVYEGEFKRDNRNGIGKMTWNNGEIYIGKWKNGVQHGQGEVRAQLYSCPIKKQFIFENGKALKSQSFRKEVKELNLSPKRKFSNSTSKNKKPQESMKKMMSLNEMRTRKNKQVVEHNLLHNSFFKAEIKTDSPSNPKYFDDQAEKIRKQEKQILDLQKSNLAHAKINGKHLKKSKLKTKMRPKNNSEPALGETLLKPIKWTNFKQSWQQQLP